MVSITVNSFFGCCKLETGGLFIGWLYIIIHCVTVLVVAVPVVVFLVFATIWCSSISYQVQRQIEAHVPFSCGLVAGLSLIFLLVFALTITALIFIALTCIEGVKTRNDTKIVPMMVLVGFVAFSTCSAFLSLSLQGIVFGIFGVVWGYFFIVLFSLYSLFRDEKDQGVNIKMDNITTIATIA